MIEIIERVGAEPKVIPTPAKAEPKKPAKPAKDAETKEEKKNDKSESSETPEHENDHSGKEDVHD